MFLLSLLAAPTLATLLPNDPAAPGCVVDVRRGGQVIAARAVGRANLETPAPLTADAVLEVGSVAKQFVGAGLALLAARGTLSLDDPVRRWLPELPPLYRGVTLRMLATHTAGIRSWNNLAELTGRGADESGYDNRWVLAAVARQRRLNHAPGTEYLYSNAHQVLGALVIERASGRSLDVFFRTALFDRLGMTRTRWRTDPHAVVPGRAQAYAPDGAGGWRIDVPLGGVVGAGGLLSTVSDLQRWHAALADPAPEDRAWVALLERPGTLADGTRLRYAMGLELDPIAGRPALAHAGSTGSYHAWAGRVPAARLSVALLCNDGSVNTEDIGPQVAALYLPPAPAPVPPARGAAGASGLAGLYRNAGNDALVTAVDGPEGVRFNDGPAFAGAALATADGSRRATATRGADGRVAAVTLTRVGNAPVRLLPVAAWRPGTAELARLAGSYASDEIGAEQRIVAAGGRLVWIDPAGDRHPLEPVYRDALEAPGTGWTLRFRRSPDGTAVGVDYSITRARRIAFARVTRRGSRPTAHSPG